MFRTWKKISILYRSADKVYYFKSTSVQQHPMGFWMGRRSPFWTHFIWIRRVLSPLRLFTRTLFQNTFPSLCYRSIFSSRLGMLISWKISKKSYTFISLPSSCLHQNSTKSSSFSRDFGGRSSWHHSSYFPLWSQVFINRVPPRLNLLKITSFGMLFLFRFWERNKAY